MTTLSNILIDDLIVLGLKLDRRDGIAEFLKFITQSAKAKGCILWGQFQQDNRDKRSLFTLAQWFDNSNPHALHNIKFDESLAGKAIDADAPFYVRDVKSPHFEHQNACARLLEEAPLIRSYFSVPIHFDCMASGALNIYFEEVITEVSEEDMAMLGRIAVIFSGLYKSIRERAGFHIIKEVNEILYQSGDAASDTVLTETQMNRVIQKVCDCVSKTLHVKETSIFLEDEYNDVQGYEMRGSTCRSWITKSKKTVYEGKTAEGLTGWALKYRSSVRIFDLQRFETDKREIQSTYPGIQWSDPYDISRKMARQLKTKVEKLPPLGFMAVPIVLGQRLVGVIRCGVALHGPYYFAEEDIELLHLVGIRIAQYWRNWIAQRTVSDEVKIWERVVNSLDSLNQFVWKGVDDENLGEEELFQRVFESVKTILPEASIMDVRFHDAKRNCLYFKHIYGDAWRFRNDGTERSKEERQNFEKRIFPIRDGRPQSEGEVVFQTRRVRVIDDIGDPSGHLTSKTFKEVKRVIVAPLPSAQGEMLGVLDIRSVEKGKFPKNAVTIFSLLGQQIGLCYQILKVFDEKRQRFDRKRRTYEILAHQLKTPIDQAFKRSELLLRNLKPEYELERRLQEIRGLCNKSKAVTGSIKLFAELESGTSPAIKLQSFSIDDYIKMLVECSRDNQLIAPDRMRLKFLVDRDSFSFLRRQNIDLQFDYDLYLQALNCLLDNAGKYSYSKSKVLLAGGMSPDRSHFYVSIRNKGFDLSKTEARQCTKRGWRGDLAAHVRASGNGIGLWIVDHIMKAHKGKLEIIPTGSDSWTEFRLVLPLN